MKIQKAPLIILAGFILLISATPARAAENHRQVWRDSEGQIVHNTYGNCVRSRWNIDIDPCAQGERKSEMHAARAWAEADVYFAFDRADLTDQSKERLNAFGNKLASADDVEGVQITGHADRIGTVSYNEALSKKRAEAVRAYLVAQGIIKPDATKTSWVGKSEPKAKCADKLPRPQLIECLQPDRRVKVEAEYRAETQADAAQ